MPLFRQFFDWLSVKDYAAAKERAAIETAARYSRGNVAAQSGWFLDEAGLQKLSAAGDRAVSNLKQKTQLT